MFWELPTWDKPATPCLSSRIAYGEQVTPERLAMIDQAERFLRGNGFRPLRVRYHHGDVARIEVAIESLPKLLDDTLRAESGPRSSRRSVSSTSRWTWKDSARGI